VLGSETRMSFPPAPPSLPPPPEKRYVAVIAVAIATGILVVGSLMLFVGAAPGAPRCARSRGGRENR
jgi:hypothetical protein